MQPNRVLFGSVGILILNYLPLLDQVAGPMKNESGVSSKSSFFCLN
jgi:hypothetical protein